jgi:shikimate kinase
MKGVSRSFLDQAIVTILLFGVSNVGKTTAGEKLSQRMGYTFFDLDEVITRKCKTTLEQFIKAHPFPYDRHKLKGEILKELVMNHSENIVVAVSPIYYSRFFNPLLKVNNLIAIELQDSAEHIFQRLVFSDENDVVYKDDAYKEAHKNYYIKDIQSDILFVKRIHMKIEHKYFINNQPVNQVVDGLIELLDEVTGPK